MEAVSDTLTAGLVGFLSVCTLMQDNFKKFVDKLEGVHEHWDKDVLDFARKVFDLVIPAAEVRCPKDMEALVWEDVQEIISLWGSQESRAYLRKLLSTWHEGECCQCLAAGPCACLRIHSGISKQVNDIHDGVNSAVTLKRQHKMTQQD